MKKAHKVHFGGIYKLFEDYSKSNQHLPGISSTNEAGVLTRQIIDSQRRTEYIKHLSASKIDKHRESPQSALFDPIRASILAHRRGEIDEAHWLVFLATHFGKHARYGWRLAGNIYGAFGPAAYWTWDRMSSSPGQFRVWLRANQHRFQNKEAAGAFSNHRKYESLKADSPSGTASVFESYVDWVAPPRSFRDMMRQNQANVGQQPEVLFDRTYVSMDQVKRFGRLAKFDFLTMLDKLGYDPIHAGSAYIKESTGPKYGCRLLFLGDSDDESHDSELDTWLDALDSEVHLGKQVLEDSLCNWQKDPSHYRYFRG